MYIRIYLYMQLKFCWFILTGKPDNGSSGGNCPDILDRSETLITSDRLVVRHRDVQRTIGQLTPVGTNKAQNQDLLYRTDRLIKGRILP